MVLVEVVAMKERHGHTTAAVAEVAVTGVRLMALAAQEERLMVMRLVLVEMDMAALNPATAAVAATGRHPMTAITVMAATAAMAEGLDTTAADTQVAVVPQVVRAA